MQVVYIVKSFGPENGYLNLKAFANIEDAEAYRAVVAKQILLPDYHPYIYTHNLDLKASNYL